MKKILSILICLSAAWAMATPPEPPVTQAEAAAVFARAEQVIKGLIGHKGSTAKFPSGAGVATREQILRHFGALYEAVEPKIKFTPPKIKPAPGVMSIKDEQVKQIAIKLQSLGLVDRFGPLVTSKTAGLEPGQFGDALGFFMARVAELTHTPKRKFSPYLMPSDGD